MQSANVQHAISSARNHVLYVPRLILHNDRCTCGSFLGNDEKSAAPINTMPPYIYIYPCMEYLPLFSYMWLNLMVSVGKYSVIYMEHICMGCVGQNIWFSSASVWLQAGLCNQVMVNLLHQCDKHKNSSP